MNQKLIRVLCKLTQDQLMATLKKFLNDKYGKENICVTNDYMIARGQIPVALVAHLDTVGPTPPVDIYYDSVKKVMWSPQLLGADDRAGVAAIIEIVKQGYLPHIIFTTNEELGGLGAEALITDMPDCPFENLKMIIELDRSNKKDCVFYECDNKDFNKFIESFGFKTAIGSFTDISIIAPKWGVAAVNLSVGYLDEHSYLETLNLNWLQQTIDKVINILKCSEKAPSYSYIPLKTIWGKYRIRYYNKCTICGRVLSESETYFDNVCKSCYKQYY